MGVLKVIKLAIALKEVNKNEENSKLYYENNEFLKLFNMIAQAMRLPYEVTVVNEDGKLMPNGSWSGAMGMLQRGEADMGVPILVTEEKGKVVKFISPHFIDIITFAARKIQIKSEKSSIFRPFQDDIWIALPVCMVIIIMVLFVFQPRLATLSDIIFKVMASVLQQSLKLNLKSKFGRLLLFSWIIEMFFITNFYKSVILSFLTLPSFSVIKDINQLATEVQGGRFQCMIRPIAKPFLHIFPQSSRSEVRIIGNYLKENPDMRGEIESLVQAPDTKRAFIAARSKMQYLDENFYLSEDSFLQLFIAFAVKKDFCCRRNLEMIIHRLVAAGIFKKFSEDEDFRSAYYAALYDTPEKQTVFPLNINNFYEAFIALLSGYFLSLMVFLFELFLGSRNNIC